MNIQELEQQLKKTTHFTQLQTVFERFLSQYQITHYAITFYTPLNKIKYSYSSKPYELWHKHYLIQQYEEADSTMISVYRSTTPIYWDLQQQLAEAKTEREKQMRLDSIEYGAEKGVCIPVHGPFQDFATVVLVQMKGQTFLNEWQNTQHELLAASHFYYQEIKRLLLKHEIKKDKTHNLSRHQIKCLILTAKNYTVEDISRELNITERTVNFHLQKANKNLGTKNKHQSVNKAIEMGILQV